MDTYVYDCKLLYRIPKWKGSESLYVVPTLGEYFVLVTGEKHGSQRVLQKIEARTLAWSSALWHFCWATDATRHAKKKERQVFLLDPKRVLSTRKQRGPSAPLMKSEGNDTFSSLRGTPVGCFLYMFPKRCQNTPIILLNARSFLQEAP